jgi:hypothetical protein
VAGTRDNSNDVEKHDEKNSNGIVEILDDEIRYNVTVPSTAPLKRPYSKKRIGVENRDDVFVLYSAEIPGKKLIFKILSSLGTTQKFSLLVRSPSLHTFLIYYCIKCTL